MSLLFLWILSTIFWTTLMSFFSTQEMACISYNRLKLESAVRQNNQSAIKIKYMIENPFLLFGTTLFGVNLCLVLGSESLRQTFQLLGLHPTLSACIHIPYVLIVGELVPMFAARVFPEHMARLGIPFLWWSSLIFRPIIDFFSSVKQHIFKANFPQSRKSAIQLEELQEALFESIDESSTRHNTPQSDDSANEIDSVASRVLALRDKKTGLYMCPIKECLLINATKKIGVTAASFLKERDLIQKDYILLTNSTGKIIAAISSQELCQRALQNNYSEKMVQELSLPTSYSTEELSLTDLFSRMQNEKVSFSFVVNPEGEIIGVISINMILDELIPHQQENNAMAATLHVEKTISGDESVLEFLHKYGISLYTTNYHFDTKLVTSILEDQKITFSELLEISLGQKPNKGDYIDLGFLRITVLEASLLGAKSIFISSQSH